MTYTIKINLDVDSLSSAREIQDLINHAILESQIDQSTISEIELIDTTPKLNKHYQNQRQQQQQQYPISNPSNICRY